MTPTLQAVADASKSNRAVATELELTFSDPSLRTLLQLQGGQVTRVSSEILPPWSTALAVSGVHPATIAEAQQRGGNLDGALQYLLRGHFLSEETLATLAHERLISALLPLVWHNTFAKSTDKQPALLPLAPGSVDAEKAIQEAEILASSFGIFERQLRPATTLIASPLHPPTGELETQVYGAAMRGLNLGEIARRLPLRWDHLVNTTTSLVKTGSLRTPDQAVPVAVAEQLKIGEMAPDFCLPGLAEHDTRLSDLRGKPVWLVFNRQSTCALCNPHNAQIIALHEHLQKQGVQILSIWGSTLDDLGKGIGKLRPPYPVLADPRDETYNRYGLTFSLRGTLDSRNLPVLVQGVGMMGTSSLKSDGELLRMPAEFLIGRDGTIERAHYNSFGSDWLPTEEVLRWAGQQSNKTSDFWS